MAVAISEASRVAGDAAKARPTNEWTLNKHLREGDVFAAGMAPETRRVVNRGGHDVVEVKYGETPRWRVAEILSRGEEYNICRVESAM